MTPEQPPQLDERERRELAERAGAAMRELQHGHGWPPERRPLLLSLVVWPTEAIVERQRARG